ncbi:uncharacterized protein M6B38_249525 [Iris pallida]|uniref:Uncharacterized protein n=1 Tax=Iris pallida TaxID=29817 RepID=A0AAX6IL30_IRIPA|nr:uncharacterized protein M6B38_249525 [Iris pallida]
MLSGTGDKLDVSSCWILRPTKASMSWIGFLVNCFQDCVKMVLDEAKTITDEEAYCRTRACEDLNAEVSSTVYHTGEYGVRENLVRMFTSEVRKRESGENLKLRVKGFVSWLWVSPFGLQRLVF